MEGKRRASQELNRDTQKARASADLHRIHTAGPMISPTDTTTFANLGHVVTAPALTGHSDLTGISATSTTPVTPITMSKKEKAKEEKERKAAEKERERAEKQRQKEVDQKMKDAQKRQTEELKATIDATKRADTKRNGADDEAAPEKESQSNGLGSFFGRSKSLRIGSLGRKDKHAHSHHTAAAAIFNTEESSAAVTGSPAHTNNHSVIEEEADSKATSGGAHDDGNEKEKGKKSRFSMRKKSFGVFG